MTESTHNTGIERPITGSNQDSLGREDFVRRLASSLIEKDSNKATGVVIGLTGEWGSGKSSTLNLLHNHIEEEYKDPIVVRFDPWLVSAKENLIAEFFLEIIGTINSDSKMSKLSGLAKSLSNYAVKLSPIVDTVVPVFSLFANSADKALNQEESIVTQRKKIEKALNDIQNPIIVMIDELDRAEDHEIRTMAQVIRSVADFSAISYIVAYDAKRVIQALGGEKNGKNGEERGRAYLEKIVQLQISLPVLLPAEIEDLLFKNIEGLAESEAFPENWKESERVRELMSLIIPSKIRNIRDVKRLIGTYKVLLRMVVGEVDPFDLLGYCVLLIKAPMTVEKIRENYEYIVINPVSSKAQIAQTARSKSTVEEEIDKYLADEEKDDSLRELIGTLFRELSGDRRELHQDAVSLRRPILTVLRLGIVPGEYSLDDITNFLVSTDDRKLEILEIAFQEDKLGFFFDRLEEIYPPLEDVDHLSVWESLSEFVEKRDPKLPAAYDPKRGITKGISSLFLTMLKARPDLKETFEKIFESLLKRQFIEFPSSLLWDFTFEYGILGSKRRNMKVRFFDAEMIQETIEITAKRYREMLLRGELLPRLRSFHAVYLLEASGEWDDRCRRYFDEWLIFQNAMDAFVIWSYGPGYGTGNEFISKLTDYEIFKNKVQERINSSSFSSLDPSLQAGYQKAIDFWGVP